MAQATPDAERLVSDWVDVWNNGEYEKIPDVVADSATIYDPGAPDGRVRGHDEIEAFLRGLRAGFLDSHIAIDDMLVGETVVMVEWTVTGTHEGEFNDIPPTGREIDLTGMSKILVADSKYRRTGYTTTSRSSLTSSASQTTEIESLPNTASVFSPLVLTFWQSVSTLLNTERVFIGQSLPMLCSDQRVIFTPRTTSLGREA